MEITYHMLLYFWNWRRKRNYSVRDQLQRKCWWSGTYFIMKQWGRCRSAEIKLITKKPNGCLSFDLSDIVSWQYMLYFIRLFWYIFAVKSWLSLPMACAYLSPSCLQPYWCGPVWFSTTHAWTIGTLGIVRLYNTVSILQNILQNTKYQHLTPRGSQVGYGVCFIG